MDQSLISIIVPVYKAEPYLDECVGSLVNQTYKNIEIILVDDGSPDHCPAICDAWAAKDNRIRVIHKMNGGSSSARNVGIDNARGSYIGFVDSDDFFDARMYEKLHEGITRSSNIGVAGIKYWRYESGVVSIYNGVWDTKKDMLVKASEYGILALKKKICHAAPNKLYKKCIFEKLRFREGAFCEDVLFSHDLSKVLMDLNLDMWDLDYYAYYYRIHQGSLCRSEIPIDISYIHNLLTIIDEEEGESAYKSAAIDIFHHTLYDSYYILLNDNSSNGKVNLKLFLNDFQDQIKLLKYKDVMYKENQYSLYAYLSFLLTKYWPNLYLRMKSRA